MKKTIIYILVSIIAICFFAPFVIMISGSFNDLDLFVADPLFWLPTTPTIENYAKILINESFPRWFMNSVIITIIPVITQVFFCTLIGYIFAKKEFKGKELIFWSLLAMVMVPRQLLIIPNYILFNYLSWIDTYLVFIVPELWTIMGVFLIRQYLQSIPKELEEAAWMDGATDLQIFFKVIMPLSKPAMATIGTFAFIGNWNDLFSPLIFTTSEEMYPLTVGLATLLDKTGNFGLQMAGATLSFIPTFLVFIFFQKYFTEGISLSGLK
ncbi:ABC-type glycerol-3-phosphate transport system permease component [Fictibacillus halophilus]|uniref:ABC-type glycerol-3-phosphate transport system permease component n=1 Tax=Fictibacillus halophilus TaxID=1610490 RepID=A0ABV2LDZ7_9BACL|nr:carbohydrate ABC transporter permease [Fictibacillus halophilus]